MGQVNDAQAGTSTRAVLNGLLALGAVITIAGVAFLVLPGPGLPVLALGLLLLVVANVMRLVLRP